MRSDCSEQQSGSMRLSGDLRYWTLLVFSADNCWPAARKTPLRTNRCFYGT
jgi:hypothetical protein